MIRSLKIEYTTNCGLTHIINVPTDDYENIPYYIADIVKELIRVSNSNPDVIIEDLEDTYLIKSTESN